MVRVPPPSPFTVSKNWEGGIFHLLHEEQVGVWNCFQKLTNGGSVPLYQTPKSRLLHGF